jgi:superfamily I DNA/RNA helicase
MFVERGFALNVEFAVIDEAQDLSALQWRVLTTAFSKAKQVYIAGDDDQSIYKWSGADLDAFMSLEGEKEILSQSYRLPRAVHKRATEIISNVPKRFSKPFSPRDEEGEIDSLQTIDYLNINPAESTMILVRNVYLLSRVQAVLKGQGHPYLGRHGYASVKQDHVDAITCWEHLYKGREISAKRVKNMVAHMQIGRYLARGAKVKIGKEPDNKLFTWTTLVAEYGVMQYALWHEALEGIDLDTRAYYLSIMHSGRKITETPKVTIQTVHGVKGGEADHVILLPDMSKRTYEQYQKNAAEETRVAYVAVTRAKRKLSIVLPSSQRYYPY